MATSSSNVGAPASGAMTHVHTYKQEINMNRRMHALAVGTMLMLTACSSADERLCRAAVTKDLLNPETASFSGFSQLSIDVIRSDELLRGMKEYADQSIGGEGARYFKAKLQAQGKLGNTITEEKFCAISKDATKCGCV